MSDESRKEQTKGNLKETIGNVTGDKDLESEGKKDKNSGKAKEYVEDTKDKVNETIDKFTKDNNNR